MRTIAFLLVLISGLGNAVIAGLNVNNIPVTPVDSHLFSFSSEHNHSSDRQFNLHHNTEDVLILQEVFEEDTEEKESHEPHSFSGMYDCSSCEQYGMLKKAYLTKRLLPSKKYLTFSTIPLWIEHEVFRL